MDKVGVGGHKCVFDGVHKASEHSSQEITHTMLYGKGRKGGLVTGCYSDVTQLLRQHLLVVTWVKLYIATM